MAIAFVAAWAGKQQNHGGTSLALTAINSTGANFIAVAIECDTTLATTPVTDNFGNTYQKAYGPLNFTSGDKGYLYYAENPTVGASHVITITATGTAFIAGAAACYSGLATSGTLDQVVGIATGSGTTLTTGTSGTTATANEVVIVTGSQDTGSSVTWSAGTGFTLRASIGNASAGAITFIEDKIVTSTGTQQGTANSTVSANWGCALATFKAAGSGGASGSAAITEGADSVSGTGSVGVSGSAAISEGSDSVAASGTVSVSGSAAITEGTDTVAASGTAGAAGLAAIQEGSDTVAASGSVGVSGSASISEGADTVSASGQVGVSGSVGITEGADTVTASGTAVNGAVGAAAILEGFDTAAGTGAVGVSGIAAITEDGDIVVASGSVPIVFTPPSPPSGALPGWLGEELGTGMGPYKRPGQVFGEVDPTSPFMSSRPIEQRPEGELLTPSVAPVLRPPEEVDDEIQLLKFVKSQRTLARLK